jgi:phenylacetate-CoA ligase
MPLLRYDLGDRAVLGPPCPCGRGLPVVERVLGRVHQTLVTPTGDRIWLVVGVHRLREFAPVVQHQWVQKAYDRLEMRLVASRPPTAGEAEALRGYLQSKMPAGVTVSLVWVDDIPRTPGGKFLDFVSELPG